MAGTERVNEISVVFAPCIFIADQQGNGRAARLAFEQTGKDLDSVGFLALGHMTRRARSTAIQIRLNVVSGERQARRTPIDDTADGGAMAFAEGGDGENVTKSIAGHTQPLRSRRPRLRSGAFWRAGVGWVRKLAFLNIRSLQEIKLDAQLLQLFLGDSGRSVSQWALGALRFWKRNHVADRVGAAE